MIYKKYHKKYMSKLYSLYNNFKKSNNKDIYLFKSGIFYIFLDEDAKKMSNIFNLKLTNLNDQVVKCGFPCSSLDKYSHLFETHNLHIKIIEPNNMIYSINEFRQNTSTTELINIIKSIDTDKLSIAEAYDLLEDLKNKANKICNNEV